MLPRGFARPAREPNEPMTTNLPVAVAFFCTFLAIAAGLRADEVRLDDGRVLVGKVTEKGDRLEIETTDGVVVVPKVQVVSRRTDEQLRADLATAARTAGDTPHAHLHLAMRARDYGLDAELWRHLDRALAGLGSAGAEARVGLQRRIDEFLGQLEPQLLPRRFRTADVHTRVHQLLARLPADAGPGRAAAVRQLLIREPNADVELRTAARREEHPRHRIEALGALLQREVAGNDRFVLRTTVLDGRPEVRDAAAMLLRDSGRADAAAVTYLAPGLMHQNGTMRVRTAEALGALGHPDAMKLLVLAGPNAGVALAAADRGVRAHVAFLNQQAYIRDFDVEVAQASFIADPKIATLQSGSVLDVTVAGVFEETVILRAYRGALKRLGGSDPGADPRAWPTWLANLPGQGEGTAPATPAAPTTPGARTGR